MSSLLAACLLSVFAAAEEDPGPTATELQDAARFVQEHPDFGRRFTREWEKQMAQTLSARPHHAFVRRKGKVPLSIEDPGRNIRASALAKYDSRGVTVNRVKLVLDAMELERRGISRDRLPAVMALKSLPLVVHEISHAIDEAGSRAATGSRCNPAGAEEEFLAFADGARVMEEKVAEDPSTWSDETLIETDRQNGIALESWYHGPEALMSLVRENYSGKMWLTLATREELLAEWRRLAKSFKGWPGLKREGLELKAQAQTAAQRAEVERILATIPDDAEVRRTIANAEACVKAFSDPVTHRKYQEYYRKRLAVVDREWKERGR